MKHLLLASLLIFAVGCDTPQRSRAPMNYVNGDSLGDMSGGTTGGFSNIPSTTSGSTSGSTTGSTTPSGFETCDLSDKYQTIDIGFFGLCQSSSDETAFRFKPSLSSPSVRVCLIPTYKEASGSSTWLGQPQCTYTTSGQTINGRVYKDRAGYTSFPINGLIVMKEPLLPEYFGCMNAYTNWPANVCQMNMNTAYCQYWVPRCGYGAKSNTLCDTEARNYMNQACTTFKSKYVNSYIDIRLK